MKKYTLREAWAYLDKKYPPINVYDAYVGRQDYMAAMDVATIRYEISKELMTVEITFGITRHEEKIRLLQDKLELITLPLAGYKYDVPEQIEKEIKEEYRKTKKQINELEKELEVLYDTIYVEAGIMRRIKLT